VLLCAEDFHLRESFARGDLPSKKSVRSIIQQVFSKKVSGTGKGMKIEMGLRQVSGENDIKVRPYTGSHAREATMTASSVILPY
jgi:hypothetical protein